MHKLTLPLVLLVLLAVVLVLFGARLYQVVPVGHVAVATLFGSVRPQSYPEGLHVPVNPLYPSYLKLQALEALQAISKAPAAKVYFLNGDSPTPLPLMHLGEDPRLGRP